MIRIASLAAPVVVLAAVLSATHANADVAVSLIDIGLPNTIAVKMTGPFTGNEILRLKAVIADLPPTKRVVVLLDSPGGAVVQGEALGRLSGGHGGTVLLWRVGLVGSIMP